MKIKLFLENLDKVASSPFAFVAYIFVAACWVFITYSRMQLQKVSEVIKDLPESERKGVVMDKFNASPREGLTAEQWIKSRSHMLLFWGFLSVIIAITILSTITITQSEKKVVVASNEANKEVKDWQMFLNLEAIYASVNGKILDSLFCFSDMGLIDQPKRSLRLPRNSLINFDFKVHLVIDNVFEKNKELIYPTGFTTTWDHRIFNIDDGMDVKEARMIDSKYERDHTKRLTLLTPDNPSKHYLIVMSGATLNHRQLFYFSSKAKDEKKSIWNESFTNLAGNECGGYLEHDYIHLNSETEKCNWPIIALPVEFY